MSRPTIYDVARKAAVGLSTVSRVLAGSPRVSEETRRRVTGAIARLGYRASPTARGLASGRSQTIEVIVPLLTRYFYFEVLGGLLAGVADTDYCLNVRVLERPADRDWVFGEVDRRGRPDGLLVVRAPPTEELLTRLGRAPAVAVLVDATHPELSSVGIDHRENAAMMVRHQVGFGHRCWLARLASRSTTAENRRGRALPTAPG